MGGCGPGVNGPSAAFRAAGAAGLFRLGVGSLASGPVAGGRVLPLFPNIAADPEFPVVALLVAGSLLVDPVLVVHLSLHRPNMNQ